MDQILAPPNPFILSRPTAPARRMLFGSVFRLVEELTGLRRCQRLYAKVRAQEGDFLDNTLAALGIDFRLSEEDLQRIPAKGGLVVVANHPFGAAEGLALMARLRQRRGDVRFIANHLLGRIPELREHLIEVNPFGGQKAARENLASLRAGLKWVQQGGALVLFPAGEVSGWAPGRPGVSDPEWHRSVGYLVRQSGAKVVPVFFPGRNSLLFQGAGLIHPLVRTSLLGRELLNKKGVCLQPRIGAPISPRRLLDVGDDRAIAAWLRRRTYLLGRRGESPTSVSAAGSEKEQGAPLQAEVPALLLEARIRALPTDALLLESGDFQVFIARGEALGAVLAEIGRLRELTFRVAGEGTGSSCDLDEFDGVYRHLFIWDRSSRRIVGAYRLGASDEILPAAGVNGFYSATLFRYNEKLFEHLHPALEMGRSFVRPEYQRSYAPLLLLWKGIGAFLVREPRYRYLFGPVSISRNYSDLSRTLMMKGLLRSYLSEELASMVTPREGVGEARIKVRGIPSHELEHLGGDVDELSEVVSELETDGKGVPVLLRHYLGLGGRLLAFNLDRAFSDVIDGLLLVDMPRADRRQLSRYLGRDGAKAYLAHHEASQ